MSESVVVRDARFPETERFPRHMVFLMTDTLPSQGPPEAELYLMAAKPNPFPIGPFGERVGSEIKQKGFMVGMQIGNTLTDNAYQEDGYRFHDALHLGLLAVTGWSPVMRSLLGLKRRSDPIVDTIEDGGRAIVLEEGLFGFLGSDRQTYKDPFYNDADIEVATAQMWHKSRAVLPPGETIPYELWKKAIILGQNTLYRLVETIGTHAPQDEEPTKCAYLTADLDHQSLDLSFKPPEPLHNLLKP